MLFVLVAKMLSCVCASTKTTQPRDLHSAQHGYKKNMKGLCSETKG